MSGRGGFFIELGSITNAHKAQRVLEQNGISSEVIKVPSSSRGCSYGIRGRGKKEEAVLFLKASSIKLL